MRTTLLPTTLDEAGDDAAASTSAGSCDPIWGLVKRLEPGIGAVNRSGNARGEFGTLRRGTTVERGPDVVGTVVVGAVVVGTVVVGEVVLGASGASSPSSPPPESPPPPPPSGLLGIVVEVGGTVVDGEEACGGLALRRE